MNWKNLTIYLIGILLILILGYDVLAIVMGGTEASISSVIINFSYKMPLVPFMTGVLMGHLFWRMKGNKDTRELDNGN